MVRPIAYRGPVFTICYAVSRKGDSPGEKFFETLTMAEKAKSLGLFKRMGDAGSIVNDEKFGDLGKGLKEFKSFQIRMPCVIRSGQVIISHGFIKKKQKTPPEEIDRAWRILDEDASLQAASQMKPKLQIVKKAGKS